MENRQFLSRFRERDGEREGEGGGWRKGDEKENKHTIPFTVLICVNVVKDSLRIFTRLCQRGYGKPHVFVHHLSH